MRSAVRFLAWMAVVLAIGVQATGLGGLGFNLCVERSGGMCTIEAFGQRCCAEGTIEASADDRLLADTCDCCIDMPLALPLASAVTSTVLWEHLVVHAVPPTVVMWTLPTRRIGVAGAMGPCRNRPPPIPDSLLVAKTIVLRI